jgi:hypothetical protein
MWRDGALPTRLLGVNSRRTASLIAAALLIAACSGSDDTDGDSSSDTSVTSPAGSTVAGTETSDPDETDEAVVADDDGLDETATTVDGGAEAASVALTVEPSPHIAIAATVAIDSEVASRVEVVAESENHRVDVPRTANAATLHEIPLVGMRPESTYEVSATLFDEDDAQVDVVAGVLHTTGSLPTWFAEHELTIDADRAAPGYTIVEFDTLQAPDGAPSSQHLVAYDNEGEVVWYYTNTGALAGVEPTPAGTFNMFYWPFGIREVDILGNVVSNWQPQPAEADGDTVDPDLIVEGVDPDQVQFQGGIDALAGNPGDAGPTPIRAEWLDVVGVHHESWPMPNGNVLTLTTTEHELTPEQRATFCPDDSREFNAISDVAIEFEPSGRVVRSWDLWEVIDIDEFPGRELCVDTGIFAGDGNRDWNHANSVIYDPERDAIIVSSRHTNQIIAFDHLDDEGPQSQLRWILGDGATIPFEGEQTYYQHAVEVNDDGTLVIYDNGNFRPGTSPDDPDNPLYSRAVIYDVDDSSDDPADWSARQVWEHVDLDDDGTPVFTEFIGDADVLENGNVLITHGGIGAFPPDPADPLNLLVREVVPSGESGGDVVWELRSVDAPPHITYRTERIPSFYFGPDWEA